jgi:hypothetical protein
MYEGITINYVDADNSWTLVQRRKKKKTKRDSQEEKWNAQQRENFLRFSDIYKGESYKNYRNVDVGPTVANIPLQQQVAQPPVVQIIPPPPAVPAPVQPLPVIAAAPPPPIIVVMPPPKPAAQGGQKCTGLETKKENRSRREQVIEALTPPPLHQPPATPSLPKTTIQLPTPRLHNQKTPEVPLEPEATTFSRSFNVWPLHQMQILPDGSTRYRLMRDEKEQLKFLGLENLFNTSWSTSGVHHSGLGKCKKT